jgi:hypothetical protein
VRQTASTRQETEVAGRADAGPATPLSALARRVGSMAYFGIGTLLQVVVLFINAVAILNEERFLARSASCPPTRSVMVKY